MSKIVPKLNLNKTPQLVDNNSLVMAKNIRLLEDGTIGPDTSLEEIETNTGDFIEHSREHPAITQTVTDFFYSILNYSGVIKVIDDNRPDLDTDCFNFGNNDPNDPWDDNYRLSNLDAYKAVAANNDALIYCYRYTPTAITWISNKFIYDINNNFLIDNAGYLFLIAIRFEIISNSSVPNDGKPDFFYTILPKQLLNTNIVFNDAQYLVCNPVYQTKHTHQETIQEAWTEYWTTYDTVKYIAHIVGLNNKIYFFKESNYIKFSAEAKDIILDEYPSEVFVGDTPGIGQTATFDVDSKGYVTRNGILFQDSTIAGILSDNNFNSRVKIFEYDEVNNDFQIVECAWKYSGGDITGCVTVNSSGEYILTICEYNVEENSLVPIKHINLVKCTVNDDESFYTQAPNIPITNLINVRRYIKNIPAGVYQFFIRYKIRDEFYTNWFPCSKELFAASTKQTDTLQGNLKHIDLHQDSNYSFIFQVENLFSQYCSRFEQYQLGFIISSEGGIFARSWKHFDMTGSDNTDIYFEYNQDDIEEINIDDLLKVNYDIFNVGNIAPFKNRLYIANYTETDFNENLENYAKNINIKLKLQEVFITGRGYYFTNIPLKNSIDYPYYYDKFGNNYIRNTFGENNYCVINDSNEKINSEIIELPQTQPGHFYDLEEVKELYRNHVSKVYFIYNNSTYYICNEDTNINNFNTYSSLIEQFISEIRNNIIGIDINGNYKYNNNGNLINISNIIIEYTIYDEFQFSNDIIGEDNFGNPVPGGWYIPTAYYKLTRNIELKDIISETVSSSAEYREYNSLLPFTKYDFYIHYIKQNGIVTNGYFIDTKEIKRYTKGYSEFSGELPSSITPTQLDSIDNLDDLCFYDPSFNEYAYYQDENTYYKLSEFELDDSTKFIIYPSFDNIECPPGYVGCFISISKYGNKVAQAFNVEKHNYSEFTNVRLDCLELDCLLYNTINRIKIIDSKANVLTENGSYYSSSATTPIEHLGGSGYIEFQADGELTIDTKCWIIFESTNKPYNKTLVKITPYIDLTKQTYTSYSNYEDVNTPGYLCEVSKLSRQYTVTKLIDGSNNTTGYYVSGSDVYKKRIDDSNIELTEIEDYLSYGHSGYNAYILSNFNLNYVSLTQDLNPIIRRYNIAQETTQETTQGTTSDKTIETSDNQFITLVDSLICSFILELKSTYKDYTKKLYYNYTKNKKIKFDNTIRVSSIDTDEIYRYIYRFEATDYYNVPTQRGIITNLISVANTLYVHCEHSLFKFTDNKTIDTQNEQIVLQENDIFNSGISEIFDAQYGYAGLQNRKQSLITYNAYVFYDAVAKIIYAFGGEQQIGNISEPIKKLIKDIDPTDVQFVGDELNNRFFVNLINESGNVCLSFNFNSKSFVSIHDITFKFGFHSRRHTYFVHDNIYDGDIIGWSIYRIVENIQTGDFPNIVDNYIAYQNCYEPSLIQITDCDNILLNPVKSVNACVDVIINTEYEKIKQLDYISWICSEILEYGNNENLVAEEVLNRKYPGTKLRIYSDSTKSDLFELLKSNGNAKISNEERNVNINDEPNPDPNSWQYPQYNCGVWSMNYFRDVLNTGDIFNYKASKNKITGGSGHSNTTDLIPKTQRENLTQESSLIYGKYFVLRFIFNNKNFKLENVMLKMNDYGKTK